MSEPLLTYQQAAEKLGVSDRTVRRLVAQRKLASVKLSHTTIRFTEAALERCKEKFTRKALC